MQATVLFPTSREHAPNSRLTGYTLDELVHAMTTTRGMIERGCGISQIIERAPAPDASANARLLIALMLRANYWQALVTGSAQPGMKNNRRDLERTIRYIDRRVHHLAIHATPAAADAITLPPIRPMATDLYGAEIDVREGPVRLAVITDDGEERHDIIAVLLHLLGERQPSESITVNLPAGWRPTEPAMRSLANTIQITYASHWWNRPRH